MLIEDLRLIDELPAEHWCFVNGLPGRACPDHARHHLNEERSPAGRCGEVLVVPVSSRVPTFSELIDILIINYAAALYEYDRQAANGEDAC